MGVRAYRHLQRISTTKASQESHKDYVAPGSGPPSAESLSRSLSTDDSENNSSAFNQDDDMQNQVELMERRKHSCPCGCPGMQMPEERDSLCIKTREIVRRSHSSSSSTTTPESVDRVFGFEVLRYQGRHYCAEEIALLWKKDCRMWLWKCRAKLKQAASAIDQRGC